MRTILLFAGLVLAISISSLNLFSQDNCNMNLGNPSNAAADTLKPENYLISEPDYSLSYNNAEHIPNWVSWHVDASDLGTVKRRNDFRPDNALPVSWYRVKPSDYARSGFDKGHMCPSGDRTSSPQVNSNTFLMINMVPQAPNNNRITWEHLEAYCRKLVKEGDELYIIAGPYGQGGQGKYGEAKDLRHQVEVPAQTWKIIVVLKNGNDDLKRIDTHTRVIAVMIPNDQSCSKKDWSQFRVSVNTIASLTGYSFLTHVPGNIRNVLDEKVDAGNSN